MFAMTKDEAYPDSLACFKEDPVITHGRGLFMLRSELFIRKKGVLRALTHSLARSLLPSCFSPSPSLSPRSRSHSLCVISIMEFRPSFGRRPQTAICWLLRRRARALIEVPQSPQSTPLSAARSPV